MELWAHWKRKTKHTIIKQSAVVSTQLGNWDVKEWAGWSLTHTWLHTHTYTHSPPPLFAQPSANDRRRTTVKSPDWNLCVADNISLGSDRASVHTTQVTQHTQKRRQHTRWTKRLLSLTYDELSRMNQAILTGACAFDLENRDTEHTKSMKTWSPGWDNEVLLKTVHFELCVLF